MSIYPNTSLEYYNGSSWTNITAYITSDIDGFSGMATSSPIDRVATLGTLEFELDNSGNLFTPYGGDAVRGLPTLTGFNKGAKVRLMTTLLISKVVWFGRIDAIDTDDGTWGDRKVRIRCVDWISVASKFPMKAATLALNKKINEAMTTIMGRVAVQPEATSFSTGTNTFVSVFDNVGEKTKAIAEMNKLTLSELSYTYMLMNGTLKVENFSDRRGCDPLTSIPDYPSGNTTTPLLSIAEKLTTTLSDSDLINISTVNTYPAKTDTSLVVVYSLGSPIPLAANQSLAFTGYYTDPNGGNAINATNQQPPSGTLDYLLNTQSNGAGADMTTSLTVSATYHSDSVDFVLTNTNPFGNAGYVTKLNVRGYGIYRFSPAQTTTEDTGSENAYGELEINIDQRYKTTFLAGKRYSMSILKRYGKPKSRLTQIQYDANLSGTQMQAFMYLDIGNKIQVYDNKSGITEHYYITSRKFKITTGKVIKVTYGIIPCSSYLSGQLKPLVLRFNNGVTNSGVQFPYNEHVLNLAQRSTSMWVYPASGTPAVSKVMAIFDGTFGVSSTQRQFWFNNAFTGYPGTWISQTGTVTENAWNHVVFTQDTSVTGTAAPEIWINGVPQRMYTTVPPSGTRTIKVNEPILLGNAYNYAFPYYGYMKDFRVYDKALTSGEIAALYNSGNQDYTLGTNSLIFQGIFVHADEGDATSLNGLTVTTQTPIDNIYYSVGTPVSTVYISSP
jgi:hypothetical protein